jgi:hypothetical protein
VPDVRAQLAQTFIAHKADLGSEARVRAMKQFLGALMLSPMRCYAA